MTRIERDDGVLPKKRSTPDPTTWVRGSRAIYRQIILAAQGELCPLGGGAANRMGQLAALMETDMDNDWAKLKCNNCGIGIVLPREEVPRLAELGDLMRWEGNCPACGGGAWFEVVVVFTPLPSVSEAGVASRGMTP